MNFQTLDDIDRALRTGDLSTHQLHKIWEQRQPVAETTRHDDATAAAPLDTKHFSWLQSNIALAQCFTTQALKKEEFLLVCDAAKEALRLWPIADNEGRINLVRVRMDYAKALTRLGRLSEARRELQPWAHVDSPLPLPPALRADLFLRLGDILREEARHATDDASRQQAAYEALEFYEHSLRIEPGRLDALALTAAASLVLSSAGSALREGSHERARQVLARVNELENTGGPRWETRESAAVAYAVLGQLDEATWTYQELANLEDKTIARLAEARYWAEFLAKALDQPSDYFKKAFPPLRLIVFSGHVPDLPGTPARFPAEAVPQVREQIRTFLREMNACVGLLSTAAGADLLFIEALLEREGTVHLVLPWSEEEFRRTSITPYEPPGQPPVWGPLFDRALEQATTVRQIGQVYKPDSDAGWEYMLEVTAGLALHTARVSRLDVQPVVLWDGKPGRGPGGTAGFRNFWRHQLHQEPIVLEPPKPPPGASTLTLETYTGRSEHDTLQQQVKSMLFADIVGYSKLMEKFIPKFVDVFLARVSRLAASSRHSPRNLNTWGDAVYTVFDFAHDAGCFALELLDMIKKGEGDWINAGLYWEDPPSPDGRPRQKHPLNIRIGLHTGPVFMHYDPVVRHLGYTGTHVNRAARIEPVAAPGEVYASEEFVALAELGEEIKARNGQAVDIDGFASEYAGTMQLAKGYPGRYRIYRLIPTRVVVMEELAQTAHAAYCAEAWERGETAEDNPALRPWEDLPEDYRQANRAQVADIANKLRSLGYELTAGHGMHPSLMVLPPDQLEAMAVREHDRWMKERLRQGWTHANERDNARKHHPMLVSWDHLSEAERDKDRHTILNLPRLVEQAGLRLNKIVGFSSGGGQ